jgi:hypothetical protein
MNIPPYLSFRHVGIGFLILAELVLGSTAMEATCYKTPRLAIQAIMSDSPLSGVSSGSGYKVSKVQSDPILGHRWAMVVTCGHSNWPALAFPVSGSESPTLSEMSNQSAAHDIGATPVIRVGEVIRLWRQEEFLRIEMTGVAEENGDLGKVIRVRLVRANGEDQSPLLQLAGVVRGPSDVEIQR